MMIGLNEGGVVSSKGGGNLCASLCYNQIAPGNKGRKGEMNGVSS